MEKFRKFEKQLTELKVPYFKVLEVTDEIKIKEYTEIMKKNEELPTDVSYEFWLIEDTEEIKELNILTKTNEPLPKNVLRKNYEEPNGNINYKYFLTDIFKFKIKIYLEESELDFALQVKQSEQLEDIRSMVKFFYVLAWISIVFSIIVVILILINANS